MTFVFEWIDTLYVIKGIIFLSNFPYVTFSIGHKNGIAFFFLLGSDCVYKRNENVTLQNIILSRTKMHIKHFISIYSFLLFSICSYVCIAYNVIRQILKYLTLLHLYNFDIYVRTILWKAHGILCLWTNANWNQRFIFSITSKYICNL